MSTLVIASIIISIPGLLALASSSMRNLLEIQEKLLEHNSTEGSGAKCRTLRIAVAKLSGGEELLVAIKAPTGKNVNNTLVVPELLLEALELSSGQKSNLTIGNKTVEARIVRGTPGYSLAEIYTPGYIDVGRRVQVGCNSKGITVVEEEVNRGISEDLQRITVLLTVAIAVPVVALGLRASESLSGEVKVFRIIGVSRRDVLLNVVLMGTLLIPLLMALSISSCLVFYSTALWISEYLTHSVIPRPPLMDTIGLVPVQLVLHTLMWISALFGMYRRVDR